MPNDFHGLPNPLLQFHQLVSGGDPDGFNARQLHAVLRKMLGYSAIAVGKVKLQALTQQIFSTLDSDRDGWVSELDILTNQHQLRRMLAPTPLRSFEAIEHSAKQKFMLINRGSPLTLTALKTYFSSRVPAYTPLRNVLVEVIAISIMEILSNCPINECEPVTQRQWLQAALAMQ